MVKFEFTVEDIDAENIFSIIREEVCRQDEDILKCMVAGNKESEIEWHRSRKEYLFELINKMKCLKV